MSLSVTQPLPRGWICDIKVWASKLVVSETIVSPSAERNGFLGGSIGKNKDVVRYQYKKFVITQAAT